MITIKSRWSKVWMGVFSILLPLSTLLVVSCINGPSEEECAKAEQQIEAAHKAADYQRLMLCADSLEKHGRR